MSLLRRMSVLVGIVLLLSGCGESSSPPANKVEPRSVDMMQITRGKLLFADNCARCHGESAQGAPQWRFRNTDGTFPPPPLNGSGHAWHHSHEWLREMIRSGTEPDGHMPAWGGKLSDAQIDDIIAWFQSNWPDEVYQTWAEMEQGGRTTQR
jgi:mono/diheme cytochrome c family protein